MKAAGRAHLDAVAAGAADAGSSEPDVVVWEAEQTIEALPDDLTCERADRTVEREAVRVEGRLDGAGRLTAVLGAVGLTELLDALDGFAEDPSTDTPGQRSTPKRCCASAGSRPAAPPPPDSP